MVRLDTTLPWPTSASSRANTSFTVSSTKFHHLLTQFMLL